MADFEAQSAAFMQWFTSIPNTTIHPSVSFRDFRSTNAGRGLIATHDIPAETVLFTIPRPSIMSIQTSELAALAPGLFAPAAGTNEDDEEEDVEMEEGTQNPWTALIFVMLFEYLRGEKSRWARYFDVLPRSFDTPMFWSDAELAELQASAIRNRIGRDEAEAMFRGVIVPGVLENKEVFFPDGKVLEEEALVELAHRMGSTIMSYAFDLEGDDDDEDEEMEDGWVVDKEDQQVLGMVPMADMMNADAEFNAHVNHTEAALTVVSLRAIPAGSEILNYYGPHPPSELLRKYGYITPRHARYDLVEIPFSLIRKALLSYLHLSEHFWQKAENFLDVDSIDESVVIERNAGFPGPDGLFQGDATLEGAMGELEETISVLLKALKKVSAAVVPDKKRKEEITRAVITVVLKERLAEYPTSLQEDERILTETTTKRKEMAVKVRMGEKKLLLEVLGSLPQ